MSAVAPFLEVRHVTRDYVMRGNGRGHKTVRALQGVSLSMNEGEILGIVGESGCGKSTLARLILGIDQPTSGTITLQGGVITRLGQLERARLIQPVFQDPYSSLNPRMTIGAIIMAPLDVQKEGSRAQRLARVHELMAAVGLSGHLFSAYPGQLSGGQRQRVAVARALAIKPKVLLCDEPTSALDVSVQAQVLNLIAELKEQLNLTVLLISHNLAVVNHLAHRVAVMQAGRVVEYGPSDQIFYAPQAPYTKTLVGAVLTHQNPGCEQAPTLGSAPAQPR